MGDLTGHDQGEFVEKALWVLHDTYDVTRDTADVPGLAE